MKMIKRIIKILFLMIACVLVFSVKVYALENNYKTVELYEMLLEEIDNAT